MSQTFDRMWDDLLPIGRDPRGGYSRFAWSAADHQLREWFVGEAQRRSMDVEVDRNGNLWAWWGTPGPRAFVTGSHLDSVPGGGAYDGPLGVVSGFAAVDALRASDFEPTRPIAVTCFADEEGARFGVACIGSRLAAGTLDPDAARALLDADGTTLAEAMRSAGRDPGALGRDDDALGRIGVFVELHVEQGRGLIDLDAPVGVGESIWPHGRWRLDFRGEGNHAGTTRLDDRRDPMLTFAETVLSARKRARLAGCVATMGKVSVTPGGTNAIPSHVTGWLDSRGPDEQVVRATVAEIEQRARQRGDRDGVVVSMTEESYAPRVDFSEAVRARVTDAIAAATTSDGVPAIADIPVLGTGAGHDAGVLSSVVPTAMIFVRNPTGISHDPAEHAERDDCLAGVDALAAVMREYAGSTDA